MTTLLAERTESPLEPFPEPFEPTVQPPSPDPGSGAEESDATPTGAGVREAIAVGLTTTGAAIMVGGIFQGASARVIAGLAGVAGVLVAYGASRIRRPVTSVLTILAGWCGIAVLAVLPAGIGSVAHLHADVSTALRAGSVLRPPVPFLPGWHVVLGWLLGITGFVAAWVALVARRPSLGLMLPLPLAAVAGTSLPSSAQIPSGVALLALLGLAIGLLSTAEDTQESGSARFELRRLGRSMVTLVAGIGAVIALTHAHFLFPKPAIDPAHQAQLPHTAPLSNALDRVLFTVHSTVTGPWRLGSLDVYDGSSWRLPPVAESNLKPVPRSGVVDPDLTTGATATFTTVGLTGSVLPTLPNTLGIVARGPQLAYDQRTGTVRVFEGQLNGSETYTVAAAGLPEVQELEKDQAPLPAAVRPFLSVPPAPPAVTALIARLRQPSAWATFDAVRQYVLNTVVSTGPGLPVAVPPARVADLVAGSKQGSPFEIVAAQALLARWVGVPSRIGYGFDGGEPVDGVLQVRPRNAALFVEVYFPGFKWLPVIGTPKQAKPTVGADPSRQQVAAGVRASSDIGVQFFLPVLDPAVSAVGPVILETLGVLASLALLVALYHYLTPGLVKVVRRSRRRRAAASIGPVAELAMAYAEWRDLAMDFGYRHAADTPLQFLSRFAPDAEHAELAWLVTRGLWGDLRGQVDEQTARDAQELSRSLRRRLSRAQPATVRVIAALSRLSQRDAFAPGLHEELDLVAAQGEPR